MAISEASPTGRAGLAEAAASTPGTAPADRPSVDIVLEGGPRHEVTGALLVGRSPADPTGAQRELLAWPDLSRRLAKTHLLLEWSGRQLGVTDLGSPTGSVVVGPGGVRQALRPGVRTDVGTGSVILCGGRSIKVVPHG